MKDRIIVRGQRILLPGGMQDGYILAQEGRIVSITKDKPTASVPRVIDAQDRIVAPGFVDIHVHGGGGHDFLDGGQAPIQGAAMAHLMKGSTTLYPTTVAGDFEELRGFLQDFRVARKGMQDGPTMPGVHLEGPYFAPAQAGAQDPQYLCDPDPAQYMPLLHEAGDIIARWSVAPERSGACQMGDELFARGIKASIAHTDAEYTHMLDAWRHHYTLVTHLYSCMSTIVRRDGYRFPGAIESALILEEMDVELIADGHHLPPEMLGFVYRTKGAGRIALVSDAMRAAGMPQGESILGSLAKGQKVIVEDGVAKMPDRKAFAGSVATTDHLVRTMVKQVGVPLVEAVRMMSSTPARIMGIAAHKGSIAVGMDCDLVLFDDDIRVSTVIARGNVHDV